MKKSIFTLFLVLAASVGTMFASKTQVDGIWYDFDKKSKTASVTYKGEMYNSYANEYNDTVVIPCSVKYQGVIYNVTGIGDYAFYNCEGLTCVIIPNGVISIGKWAFEYCNGLTSVTIPKSVRNVGVGAFVRCMNLTEIVWNAQNCTSNEVSESPFYVLGSKSSVKSFIFGKEVKTIPQGVCRKMALLTSITIPDSVISIKSYAFEGCIGLTSITIPNNVKSIGSWAFKGCTGLTSITIPNCVYSIDVGAFEDCHGLTHITLPDNYRQIDNHVFDGCTSLLSVTIPNSVTAINMGAFKGCTGLTSIIIPNTVTCIGKDAFYGCTSLKEFHYPEGLNLSAANIPSSVKLIAYNKSNAPLQQSNPPLLAVVTNSTSFNDATHNNAINATEQCYIRFKIKNSGKGTANNCEARVKLSGSTSGIMVQNVKLPAIAVGQTYEVSIPITADINTQDGKVTFSIDVYEPNGWGVAPFDLTIATKAFEAPFLQVVDYQMASNSGKIKKMEPFTLTFNLQNTKYGDAEQVKVKVNLPANIFVMDGSAEQSFAQIKSGETKTITLTLAANNNYPSTDIPVTIDVKEHYGKFAENKQLNIALNQTTSSSINIAAKDEPQQERKEIQLAMITADVDRNIPKTDIQNQNTFVVIIANENYQQVASVPFALNDGKIFHQYCEQTLGIPAKNIREQTNATGNQLKAQINWLRNVVEVFDNPNIIFYYAGHGIPDEASKTAYLLPVDGILSDLSTCYKLDDLYATLGDMPAGHISVFMDACFSGSKREQGMLASARGVALKARPGEPKGNMVVFSAAQGDETAYPYTSQQHGMFTYYLLKKLQDTNGDVTLQELGNYVVSEVKKQSVLENNKTQTPTVTPASAVANSWQDWKLK